MQSHIQYYIATLRQENTTTPAVISYDDAIIIIEQWTQKEYGTIEKIKKEYIPWLFIYETPEDKVEFPIEKVRELISDISIKPYEWKNIYMLLWIDTASHSAMNALLKVLEDTPEHAIILLVVKDRESLLDTIHSRTIDLFRQNHRLLNETHRSMISEYYAGNPESWITVLYSLKTTRDEAIDILIISIEYAPSEKIGIIEEWLMQLYSTNESTRNILDTVFLGR